MASLTCENHPDLVWSCKDLAISNGRYNNARNIFFFGLKTKRFNDSSGWDGTHTRRDANGEVIGVVEECSCPARDLILLVPETGEIDERFRR